MKVISLLLFLLISCASEDKPDTVKTRLESKYDEYRQCFLESNSYKGHLHQHKGEVIVTFNIDAKGEVINEKITSSTFKDANFHACLLSMIKDIKFKPAQGGETVTVTEPINFFPKE